MGAEDVLGRALLALEARALVVEERVGLERPGGPVEDAVADGREHEPQPRRRLRGTQIFNPTSLCA